MNPLDILIGGIIAYGLYLGANRGVIKGLSNLVTIGASVLLAWRFRPATETFLTEYESLRFGLQGQAFMFASFVVTFVVAFLVVSSIMGYARKVFEALPIGLNLDKALGAVMGGMIMALILSVVFMMGSTIGFPSTENAAGSLLYPGVRDLARQVLGYAPQAVNAAGGQIKKYTPAPGTDANGAPVHSNKPKAIR